jgi:hypothetical protein
MNLKRVLGMSSIAAGIGMAGIFGATATANAAPATCTASPQTCSIISQAPGAGANLTHHQQKELDKIAKKAQQGH